MKFGKTKAIAPLEVKHGARYNLELIANITIPEIAMENVEDWVDFGKVLCGQRKTFFVRFVNDKEIACDWSMNTRQDVAMDKKKEEPKFQMVPVSGCIPSKQKQVVEITFAPTTEKQYQHNFVLNIKENPKQFVIKCKGQGASINLEFSPLSCCIGPVLPYDKFAYTVLEVTNPTEYDTELVSMEFDKQYLQDEDILNNYEALDDVPLPPDPKQAGNNKKPAQP